MHDCLKCGIFSVSGSLEQHEGLLGLPTGVHNKLVPVVSG